jgi:hypothetical protein
MGTTMGSIDKSVNNGVTMEKQVIATHSPHSYVENAN